jgi:hypothetical protein
MARFFVLPSLLAKSNGPTAPAVTQQIAATQTSVVATNFQGADTAMQAWYAQNGTYAGATLPPGSGVVLVRADAVSYCLQAGTDHEVGPGGRVLPGGC